MFNKKTFFFSFRHNTKAVNNMKLSAVATVLASLVATSRAFFISIDAHAEECFYRLVIKSDIRLATRFHMFRVTKCLDKLDFVLSVF